MVQICEGTKTKDEMLSQSIDQYKDMFLKTRMDIKKVISVGPMIIAQYLFVHPRISECTEVHPRKWATG
jgi:hypothetical protein